MQTSMASQGFGIAGENHRGGRSLCGHRDPSGQDWPVPKTLRHASTVGWSRWNDARRRSGKRVCAALRPRIDRAEVPADPPAPAAHSAFRASRAVAEWSAGKRCERTGAGGGIRRIVDRASWMAGGVLNPAHPVGAYASGGVGSSTRMSQSGCWRRTGPLAGGRCTNAVRRNSGGYRPAGSRI